MKMHASGILTCLKTGPVYLCLFLYLLISYTCCCLAQQTRQLAPPVVAKAMELRAIQFLKSLNTLSPLLNSSADVAQRWPRPEYQDVYDVASNTFKRVPRLYDVKVVSHPFSGVPRFGAPWCVTLQRDTIEIAVEPRTGNVVSYMDSGLFFALGRQKPAPENQLLKQQQVVDRAVKFLNLTGISTANLVFHSANLSNTSVPPTAASITWNIKYTRSWRGVRFDDQWVNLTLDAEQGRLLAFGAAMALPEPNSDSVAVNPQSALKVAIQNVRDRNCEALGESSIILSIIQPTLDNSRDSVHHADTSKLPKLAWAVSTPIVGSKGTVGIHFADIDSVTGELIGSEFVSQRVPSVNVFPKTGITQKLCRATELTVRSMDKKLVSKFIIDSSELSLRSYYGAIGSVKRPLENENFHFHPSQTVDAILFTGERVRFRYDPVNGTMLDDDAHVVIVGDPMRKILKGKPDKR